MASRVPLKPVNRFFTPQNLSDAVLDRLMDNMKKQNQLKKLGVPNKRFCDAVEHVAANKALPDVYGDDWVCFLQLTLEVLSAKRVKKECHAAFNTFISLIPDLPKEARDAMSGSLMLAKDHNPARQAAIVRLRDAVERVNAVEEEKEKIEKVRYLERCTARPVEKGNAWHSGEAFSDIPDLQKFLESDEVEIRLYGFTGIKDARKKEADLQKRLPKHSMSEAIGKGKKAYIAIEKPCWSQRRDYKCYCENKKELEKARSELKSFQDIMRSSGFEVTENAFKKRRTEM